MRLMNLCEKPFNSSLKDTMLKRDYNTVKAQAFQFLIKGYWASSAGILKPNKSFNSSLKDT